MKKEQKGAQKPANENVTNVNVNLEHLDNLPEIPHDDHHPIDYGDGATRGQG